MVEGRCDMGRLIDSDDVLKLLTDRYEGYEYIVGDVNAIPTAYDKLAKLYRSASECTVCGYRYRGNDKDIINILKQQGY